MTETNMDRAERREEIKLRLEYLKVAGSFAVFIALLFAALQWRIANQAAELANKLANERVFSQITQEWTAHLNSFVDKPHLRPYFESRKNLTADDPNADAVLAMADVRIDLMNSILRYAEYRGFSERDIAPWEFLFVERLRHSPVLCARFHDHMNAFNYGAITTRLLTNGC